jgi:hypothetical protein
MQAKTALLRGATSASPAVLAAALASVLVLSLLPVRVSARVLDVDITSSWELPQLSASVPAYVAYSGRIRFAVDPDDPANQHVVDLKLAPRDRDGMVQAVGDLLILRPRYPGDDAKTCLLEVSNRGGKAMLRYFNGGARGPITPDAAAVLGDGLLMQLGLTLVWVGWQADVPREPGRLNLEVPVASENGRAIRGLVRSDWVVDERVDRLPLGHRNHVAYPVTEPDDVRNVLTRRPSPSAPRQLVPRSQWAFGTNDEIIARTVFDAGFIYELVYRSRDPRVVGLGMNAIRDTVSFAKHGGDERLAVERCIGFGVSQTGRFLRHFLYDGFNVDEEGRRVFDGLMIHSAGAGRGSFNHRFAQPSRDGHRYSSFHYPTDLFPFTTREQRDPGSGRTDSLVGRYDDPDLLPRVMFTNTGYEYYGRAASLIHTSADGSADAEPLASERIYLLAGGQHFVDRWPPPPTSPPVLAARGNPLDFLVNLRALMVALVGWVNDDLEPPPSLYPRLAGRSLVPVRSLDFPYIPGVLRPEVVHQPHRLDFGRRWAQERIAVRQPPTVGEPWPVFVPQVDRFGNEYAGIRNLEIRVPLATYTPWSFRDGLANPSELADFRGLFIPLPLDADAGEQAGDERPAISELYAGRSDYVARVESAIGAMIGERLVLPRDRERLLSRALETWDLVVGADVAGDLEAAEASDRPKPGR